MPYITQAERERFAAALAALPAPTTPGELNYVVTTIALRYLEGGLRYQRLNDVVGALECAKLELYRRAAAPYEDRKIAENGDVPYPKD